MQEGQGYTADTPIFWQDRCEWWLRRAEEGQLMVMCMVAAEACAEEYRRMKETKVRGA